jgi:peroxiredoxin
MRKLFVLLALPLFVISCTQKEGYKIEGNISGIEDSQVFLQKMEEEKRQWTSIDSTNAKEGSFIFTGKLSSPELFKVSLGKDKSGFLLFAENSEITVKGTKDSLSNINVTGSSAHNDYNQFRDSVKFYEEKMGTVYRNYQMARREDNEEKIARIQDNLQSIYEERQDFISRYGKSNTNSVIGPFIITNYLMPYLDYNELDSIYSTIPPEVQTTKYAKNMKERRDLLEKVQVGKPFIDFTLPDTSGNMVTFSDHVGDGYVLLDFWAGWCSPCRKENPILVENYKKYKDEGFEIFGVSFDRTKESWVKAIHDDNITWPQVSDVKGWDNKAGKKYGIRSIPANFLIGPDGKIVAKDLRGEDLEKKLKEIYE